MSSEKIEDTIRNVRLTTSTATDERIMMAAEAAMTKPKEKQPARIDTSGQIRRIIMNSKWTKLATAATVIAAIMLGIHILTGRGTSVTIAQMREAMQGIDWMQIINEGEKKGDGQVETDWYSFVSKVHIGVGNGVVEYEDFNTGKRLWWDPDGSSIIEYPIAQAKEFASGASGPFEMIDKTFRIIQAENNSEIVKELGTYEGQKVEVWIISHDVKSGEGRTLTVYIDAYRKFPVAATYDHTRQDGTVLRESNIEFRYPETGPADIYEAGAPKSAQIKHAPNP